MVKKGVEFTGSGGNNVTTLFWLDLSLIAIGEIKLYMSLLSIWLKKSIINMA